MKKINNTLKLMLSILICLILTVEVKATDNNLELMTKDLCNTHITSIVQSIQEKDISFIQNNLSMFTSSCYNKLSYFIQNNDIGGDVIQQIIIDFTYPNNSSTGDSVIMANTKIGYTQDSLNYNKVYLFEFHVNKDGDIYGFNVWVY